MPQTKIWDESFSVGHPLLDRQHQQLLRIANKAAECLHDDSSSCVSDFHLILNDLSEYTRSHFETEENLLRQRNYPDLQGQLQEHQDYLMRLAEMLLLTSEGIIDKPALHQLLTEWWVRHILVSDMQYSSYLHKRD